MKRLLLIAAFITLQAGAVITRVHTAGGSCGTAASCAAGAISTTSGNLLVGYFAHGSKTCSSVTDTAGDSFTCVNVSTGDVSQIGNVDYFYAKNITANASNVVTANLSGGSSLATYVVVIEYSGLDTVSPLDIATTAFNVSPFNTQQTALFTTSAAAEAIVCFIAIDNSRTQIAGSGYSLAVNESNNTGVGGFLWGEDQIVSSVQTNIRGSYNPGVQDRFVITAITFKAPSGGGSTVIRHRSGVQ